MRKMELRDDIKWVLAKIGKIGITRGSIAYEKGFSDSPFNHMIEIPMKDQRFTQCYNCGKNNTNWCWNCERPHCDDCAVAIFAFPSIFTMCFECADSLLKFNKEAIKDIQK